MMKKVKFLVMSVILVAGLAFVACNDKKDEKKSDDSKKTEEATTDEETTSDDEATSGGTWSDIEREQFMKSCVEGFNQSSSGLDGEKYCNCMLEKLESKYSSAIEVQQNMDNKEMQEWALDCLK